MAQLLLRLQPYLTAAYLHRSVARRLACTSSISQDGKTKYTTGTVSCVFSSFPILDLKELQRQSTIVARRKDRECPTDG